MDKPHRDPALGNAIGRIPSGVYILAVRAGDRASAMMASWVQQAAFDPPTLSVALTKDRPAYDLIRQGGAFALSVLGQDDTALMKRYARGIPPDEDPFAGLAAGRTPAGQPYLADALAWLECRLTRVVEFEADHDLVLGQVTAGRMLKDGSPFMHSRGSGWHY